MARNLLSLCVVILLTACGEDSPSQEKPVEDQIPLVSTSDVPSTTPPPTSSTSAGVTYRSCAEAEAAGAAPINEGEPGYSTNLDRDGDGIACDQEG